MFLQPGDILVARGSCFARRPGRAPKAQRRSRARIAPLVQLRMTVGKRKSGYKVMVETWKVGREFVQCRVRIIEVIPSGMGHKVAPIDGILAKVHERERSRSPNPATRNIGILLENPIP